MRYIFLLTTALSLFSCNNQPAAPGPGEQPESATPHQDGPIHLSAAQIKRAGVRWGAPEQRSFSTELSLTGELRIHPEHRALVSAFSDGILSGLHITLNKSVRKGERIATLRKYDLVDIQQQFLENRDRMAFLQAEYERYQTLKNENATALKNFQKADADLRAATTAKQLLAAKLRLYGIDSERLTADNIRTELTITAPVDGIVTAIHSSPGSALQAGASICEIADFSALHADLFVFEKDMLKVKPGQKVKLTFPGSPGVALDAVVSGIDRVVDPEKNALRIHARIPDTKGLSLSDGAYCEAQLQVDALAMMPALPQESFVREGLEEYILLLESEADGIAAFRAVQVKTLGTQDGFTAFIPKTELPKGAVTVRSGAYYVWSQGKVEEFSEEE